jgi:hypothetical protein
LSILNQKIDIFLSKLFTIQLEMPTGQMRIGSDCASGKWNITVVIYSNDIPKIKEDNKGLIRSNSNKQFNGHI